ncbi:MAG: hypothetical protein ABF608_07060 [Sporolactobacillus sp.]
MNINGKEAKHALNAFFDSAEKLKSLGIIRSSRFLGDIGEYIAASAYGITLQKNLREEGFDGTKDGKRYQIKYANGSTKNLNAGNPEEYDYLLVVIGDGSVLSKKVSPREYQIYEFDAEFVKNQKKNSGKYYICGKHIEDSKLKYSITL